MDIFESPNMKKWLEDKVAIFYDLSLAHFKALHRIDSSRRNQIFFTLDTSICIKYTFLYKLGTQV